MLKCWKLKPGEGISVSSAACRIIASCQLHHIRWNYYFAMSLFGNYIWCEETLTGARLMRGRLDLILGTNSTGLRNTQEPGKALFWVCLSGCFQRRLVCNPEWTTRWGRSALNVSRDCPISQCLERTNTEEKLVAL